MTNYKLEITLKSDTIFGRGDGLAGLVDIEIQYDSFGCPYFSGKTLKGILVEECAEIVNCFSQIDEKWNTAANHLFGSPGSDHKDTILSIGNAQLPQDLRHAIRYALQENFLTQDEILSSLTSIRQQTAMDESGVPLEHSLRSSRAILKDTTFEAELLFLEDPNPEDKALLAACVRATRRIGTEKTRGYGNVKCNLKQDKESCTQEWFNLLNSEVVNAKEA